VSVNTDATGNASFQVTTSTPVAPTSMITATATDASGNTSEFSRVIGITHSAPPASRQVQAVQPAMDVNGDGVVTPFDVLLLVNYLNSNLLEGGKSAGTFSFDVNRDGFVNPLDVLVLINALNTSVANIGQGEGPTTTNQDSVDAYFAEFANDPSQSGEESDAVTEVFAELADEPIGLVLHHRRLKTDRRTL